MITIKIIFRVILAFSLFFAKTMLVGIEFDEFPKITHQVQDVKTTTLSVVKLIQSDYDEDLFFARPASLAVSKDALFVYDAMFKSLYKFDSTFKFVTKFMREGRGPGEIYDLGMGFYKVYCAPDTQEHIYVSDVHNDKIMIYSQKGKHVKDVRLFRSGKIMSPFYPVADARGNVYALSPNNAIIEKLDASMKLVHSFLDRKLNERFVVYRPKIENLPKKYLGEIWKYPHMDDVFYDIFEENGLIIYLARSSTVYCFQGVTQTKTFPIILKEPMDIFRNRMKQIAERQKKSKNPSPTFSNMFYSFFVDKDDSRFFYLQCNDPEKRLKLYKFDREGRLVKILLLPHLKDHSKILVKKNNQFYGIELSVGSIYIYQEVFE